MIMLFNDDNLFCLMKLKFNSNAIIGTSQTPNTLGIG